MTRARTFAVMVETLSQTPFPDRYHRYRELRPARYIDAHGNKCQNLFNLALAVVMAQNFELFGVRRVAQILRWPPIQVHHILSWGAQQGALTQVSARLYAARDVDGLVALLGHRVREGLA